MESKATSRDERGRKTKNWIDSRAGRDGEDYPLSPLDQRLLLGQPPKSLKELLFLFIKPFGHLLAIRKGPNKENRNILEKKRMDRYRGLFLHRLGHFLFEVTGETKA